MTDDIYLAQNPPPEAYGNFSYDWPRYLRTNRPKTIMIGMVKNEMSNIDDLDVNKRYLPVIRYSSIYYSKDSGESNQYCGKFYYYEPESEIVLDLGNYKIYGTKIECLVDLIKSIGKEKLMEYYTNISYWGDFLKQFLFSLSTIQEKDYEAFILLYCIYAEAFSIFPEVNKQWGYLFSTKYNIRLVINKDSFNEDSKNYYRNSCNIDDINKVLKIMHDYYFGIIDNIEEVKYIPEIETTIMFPKNSSPYWKDNVQWYGKEVNTTGYAMSDWTDQIICKLGLFSGIDTFIFQREIGKYNPTTEILDTRTDTYNYLTRISNREIFACDNDEYPTVWFWDCGLVN